MTESSPTLCHSRFNEHRDDVSVGPPIPGVELRMVNADGIDVPVGQSGEVWARSPGVMLGYFRDPAATASALQDGWLRTGDLGTVRRRRLRSPRRPAQGHDHSLRVQRLPGRGRSGHQRHGSVSQSVVVGRAAERNEEVVAFVQPRVGVRIDGATLDRLLARPHCRLQATNTLHLPRRPSGLTHRQDRPVRIADDGSVPRAADAIADRVLRLVTASPSVRADSLTTQRMTKYQVPFAACVMYVAFVRGVHCSATDDSSVIDALVVVKPPEILGLRIGLRHRSPDGRKAFDCGSKLVMHDSK